MREKFGFTLIEMMVLVLIIGVLAAVALPEYQRAVTRTHFVQGIAAIKSVIDSQQLYYLENSTYATSMEDLTLSLPKNSFSHFSAMLFDIPPSGSSTPPHIQMHYKKYIDGTTVWLTGYFRNGERSQITCTVPTSTRANSQARFLCENVTSSTEPIVIESGYDSYVLSN